MNSSFYDPIDLSNISVKTEFSKYLMFWMNRNGITPESFSERAGISVRQLQRYLPGNQRKLPKKIPFKTFNDFLFTVGKTHDEFYNAYLSSIEDSYNEVLDSAKNNILVDASEINGKSWMVLYSPYTSVQCFLDSIWSSQLKFYIKPFQYAKIWALEKVNRNSGNTKYYFEQCERDASSETYKGTLEEAGVHKGDHFKVVFYKR